LQLKGVKLKGVKRVRIKDAKVLIKIRECPIEIDISN